MTEKEVEELLLIVAESDLPHTVHSYRKPLLARIFPPRDATIYSTLLRFANGTEYDGEISVGSTLTAFFYRLAEQYGRAAEEAEAARIRSLSISGSYPCFTDCYHYSIDESESGWLFSFWCSFGIDEQVEKEDCPITGEEAAAILQVVRKDGLLRRVKAYENLQNDLFLYDAPEYHTTFGFTDGNTIDAPVNPCSEVVGAFRQLAAQYR